MMRRKWSALVLAGTVLVPVCGQARAASRPGVGFEVTDYALALTPDIRTRMVSGRETIKLRATMNGIKRLTFSANALTIDSALLSGATLVPDVRGDVLGFDLPQSLRRGRSVTLQISYHGRPARGFAGSADMLYTSYFACDWMICSQERFGDKATFSVDLRVPVGMTTLSVGSMIAKRAGPKGSEIHRWKASRPYSSYLYGFAIGHLIQITRKAGSSKLTYMSDVADAAELEKRFAGTKAMADFLASKAGVPLPVPEYRQLLVGGGEAQEAATYSVLGIDALQKKPGDPSEDWAIVHELSHQWWGNLITCETIKDFWLNEGIATFMTAAWKEHRYGRPAYEAELDVARSRLEKARAEGFDKPLAWGGAYPGLRVRRAIQYSKGALFMARLRATLGEDAFWSGLRRYTRDHKGGTVTSIDLERAMERSSGRDLRPLFARWVFGTDLSNTQRR